MSDRSSSPVLKGELAIKIAERSPFVPKRSVGLVNE